MDLNQQFDSFKKKVANQVVYAKPQINQNRFQSREEQDALRRELQQLGQEDKIKKHEIKKHEIIESPHLNSSVFAVLNYLKKVDKPQSLENIKHGAQVDVQSDKQLFERLRANPRIKFLPNSHMFEFLPEHNIRTAENLLAAVEDRYRRNVEAKDLPASICFEFKELLDSNSNVKPLIEQLEEDGKIFVTRKANDNNIKAIYFNPHKIQFQVDEEFKSVWSSLKIPDETDLTRDLKSAGMKTSEVSKIKITHKQPPKKKSSSNRKIKLTNQHLEGIDLTQDYVQTRI
jgi:transcription initiation factor TFIIE subunit beta